MDYNLIAQRVSTFVLFLIAVVNFWTVYKNNNKKDIEKETERNAKINWKLDQLCKSIDDVKIESKNTTRIIEKINDKIIKIEKDNLINSHDIEDLKERVSTLEKKRSVK